MAATVALTDLGGLTGKGFPKVKEFEAQQRYPGSKTSSEHCSGEIIGRNPALWSVINAFTSERRGHVTLFRATKLLLSAGTMILVCSMALAQINSTQLVDRNPPGSSIVSRNQLLAPGKALRAAERAQKDIIDGHLESAQKEITRALDIAPHYGVAEALQGSIYLEAGNDESAAKFFQGALDDDPALGAAYVGMGVILMRQNRFQLAVNLLDRGEGLLPSSWYVHFVKAWNILELGNTEVALKQAELAEQVAGNDREGRSAVSYLRALVSIYMKDADSARKYLTEAVACDPSGEYAALAKRRLERSQPLLAGSR